MPEAEGIRPGAKKSSMLMMIRMLTTVQIVFATFLARLSNIGRIFRFSYNTQVRLVRP